MRTGQLSIPFRVTNKKVGCPQSNVENKQDKPNRVTRVTFFNLKLYIERVIRVSATVCIFMYTSIGVWKLKTGYLDALDALNGVYD